jgi:hypothetical protein
MLPTNSTADAPQDRVMGNATKRVTEVKLDHIQVVAMKGIVAHQLTSTNGVFHTDNLSLSETLLTMRENAQRV